MTKNLTSYRRARAAVSSNRVVRRFGHGTRKKHWQALVKVMADEWLAVIPFAKDMTQAQWDQTRRWLCKRSDRRMRYHGFA